jgi:molybdopterin molybdotransferase
MLSVSEAQAIVLEHAHPLPPETNPLTPAALGLVLAEDVASDLDMPPYDKSLMDGYAVRAADLADGTGRLTVVEEVMAGHPPQKPVRPGECTRIMTGGAMPAGADAVVMVERTRLMDGGVVEVADRPAHPGQNIMRRAQEMHRGQTVLAAGMRLRPQEFGLLAAVGRTTVGVHPRPVVAVLSTGDEVVEAPHVPEHGQIRNSNGPMLAAQAASAGAVARYLGIAGDREESLRPAIEDGVRSAVLLLSGGVSAGKRDLVPGVLQELGVQAHFHKVEMKPGKPVLFGTRGGSLVFGLPGNPVSALVCFELFVRPAIRQLLGQSDPGPRLLEVVLGEDFTHRSDRPTYHPAWLEFSGKGWVVRRVAWSGSADLRAMIDANALVVLPRGEHHYAAGQRLPVLTLSDRG